MLLVNAWHIVLIWAYFMTNQLIVKQRLRHAPEAHFAFARAMAVFEMVVWLYNFRETVIAARRCCNDSLENNYETLRNVHILLIIANVL